MLAENWTFPVLNDYWELDRGSARSSQIRAHIAYKKQKGVLGNRFQFCLVIARSEFRTLGEPSQSTINFLLREPNKQFRFPAWDCWRKEAANLEVDACFVYLQKTASGLGFLRPAAILLCYIAVFFKDVVLVSYPYPLFWPLQHISKHENK